MKAGGTTKIKHPLLNPDSKHYDQGTPTIQKMEQEFSLTQMLAFAVINNFKYIDRMGYKGQKESDEKKAKSYEDYVFFLSDIIDIMKSSCIDRNLDVGTLSLSELYKILNIEIDYKV